MAQITRSGPTVTKLTKAYGGADADEVQVLNGLIALGYDPAQVASFSDADPNRKFLGDAITRAMRAGIREADIQKALAYNDVAVRYHDPSVRAQELARALGLDMGKISQRAVQLAGQGGRAQPGADQWIQAVNEVGGLKGQAAVDAFGSYARSEQATYIGKGEVRQGMPPPGAPAPTADHEGQAGLARATTPAPTPAAAAGQPAARSATPAATGRGAAAGGGGVDTTVRLAPNASPDEAMAFIREHYGYSAWIFEHPDVRDVLLAAAKDGHWSAGRLKGALENTDFFKTHDGNVVSWLNTDVATQNAAVEKKVNDVIARAQALGMDLDPARARQIATDANMYGWDDTQLQKAVGHEYHYNPTLAQKGIAKQLRDTARLYGIPMTDAGLDDWGRRVGSGDSSADDFKTTMINQAKSLFPTLAGDLDRGATVKDIFDPYAKLAATTLGVDESTIDILDPKWQRPLQSTDGKNPTRMSTYDWTRTLRTDATYDWDHTDNARQEAAAFAHQLRQGFGLA